MVYIGIKNTLLSHKVRKHTFWEQKKREIALTTEKGREILHKRELLRGIRDGGGRMGGRLRGDERGASIIQRTAIVVNTGGS